MCGARIRCELFFDVNLKSAIQSGKEVGIPLLEGQADLEPNLLLRSASPAMLDEALATLEPLPAYLTEAIETAVKEGSLLPESAHRGYVEELSARGAAVWSSLAQQFHSQGCALDNQARSLPADSGERFDLQIEASQALLLASRVPEQAAYSRAFVASLFGRMRQ